LHSTGDSGHAVGRVGKTTPTAEITTDYPVAQNYTAEI
jgi:hypothetical protein